MQEEAGYEKQIYYLPLLFCFHGKNLRQHKPFLFLSSFRIKFLYFWLKAKTMYFDVIFLSLISFAKRKKNPDDGICGPQRIKLPPGSCYPPLANSSYEGGYCHPLVSSSFLDFLLDLGPLKIS